MWCAYLVGMCVACVSGSNKNKLVGEKLMKERQKTAARYEPLKCRQITIHRAFCFASNVRVNTVERPHHL